MGHDDNIVDQALPFTGHIEYSSQFYVDLEYGSPSETHTPPSIHGARDNIANRLSGLDLFRREACIYCHVPLLSYQEYKFERKGKMDIDRNYTGDVIKCPTCGWWLLKMTRSEVYYDDYNQTDNFFEGIVYQFDVSHLDRPITALRNELVRREVSLNDISPKQMEILVGSVLRDHLGCRVQHIGGPGDGGIDLFLIKGENISIVQVKRRENIRQKESVSVIREFMGTMMLAGVNRGVVATSASDFSEPAKEAARSASIRCGLEIDLFNQHRLIEILDLTEPPGKPWIPLIHEHLKPPGKPWIPH